MPSEIKKPPVESFCSLFEKGRRFSIPSYQRKYSWTDKECTDLWNDIEESFQNKQGHFIGTFFLKRSQGDSAYDIIDGQQRIITLFILLKSLIDKLEEEDEQNDYTNQIVGRQEDPKLILSEEQPFFIKILFNKETINRKEIKKRSHRNLHDAYRCFEKLIKPKRWSQKEIKERIEFIRGHKTNKEKEEKINFLVFLLEKQSQAVQLFASINDRGRPLKILDKVKAMLMQYSVLHMQGKLDDSIDKEFGLIFNDCDKIFYLQEKLSLEHWLKDEDTLFQHHYYSASILFNRHWRIRDSKDEIFDKIKKICEEKKDEPKELKKFISDYLSDFKQFVSNYYQMLEKVGKETKYKELFKFLGVSIDLYPLMVRLYGQNKLDSLLPLLEAIEIRVYKFRKIRKKNRRLRKEMYELSSESITLSERKIAERLVNFLQKYFSDKDFEYWLLNEPLYGHPVTKYILYKYTKSNLDFEKYNDIMQVEHIFPQDPSDFDQSTFGFSKNDNDYANEINRIGNLALIEKRLNSQCSNFPPQKKSGFYSESEIKDTAELGNDLKSDFTKKDIEKRNEEIAKYCLDNFPKG